MPFPKGHVPWNKGRKWPELSERRAGAGNPMYGKTPWNRGKSYELGERGPLSPEHRAKLAAAKRGKAGPLANRWRGGSRTVDGYATTRSGQGWRYEHRLVLGRPLLEDETVHHIDRDRAHNSPRNLIVLKEAHHLALHAALRADPGLNQTAWLVKRGIEFYHLSAVLRARRH